MNTPKDLRLQSDVFQRAHRTICSLKGNVLVYLIVVILIFGVLGVTIVSLFTTATSSSATPNDTRRAHYMAESGIRYALSQIRNSNFNDSFVQSLNNTPSYTLTEGGSFSINVFSPWFEYVSTSGNDLTLDVPNAGAIPTNFSIPNITLVHWSDFNGNPPPVDSYEPITGYSAAAGNPSLTITITNPASFVVSPGDIVCLAVQPTDADPVSPLQAGEDIYVALDAQEVFPPSNGAIRIVSNDGQLGDYYYTQLIPDTSNNRVRLTNLRALPGTPSFSEITNFSTDDWVVLSRQNYRLYATGRSGDVEVVTVEIGNDNPLNIFADAGVWTITMEDLVAAAVPKESDISKPQFAIDAGVDKKITIGGSGPAFGDLWYGGEKVIGGDSTFCQEGRCLLGIGIRAFFTLDYSGDGEGFIFPLISAGGVTPENTFNSVGGDIQRSETLGYAGDSRTLPTGAPFADGTVNGDGLKPPKIGLEFDTRTNFALIFEQTLDYCSDATTLKPNTRNDPLLLPGDIPTHAIQNVFWGNTTLDIPCRQDDATYDDNKHDAEGPLQKWVFATGPPGGDISLGHPAIAADGTIYMSAQNATLYALNPDGTEKWTFALGDNNEYAPGIDRTGGPADGTIYSDVSGNSLVAINPDGTEKWRAFVNSDIDSTPIVGSDGTIYFGTDFERAIFAINPDGTEKWRFSTGGEVNTSPALSPDGSVVYAVSVDDTLYAVNTATGLEAWRFSPFEVEVAEFNSSPAVNPNDGTVYVGSDNFNLYALDPAARSASLPFPQAPNEWVYSTGNDIESTPAVDVNSGTIYIGSDDNNLHAVNLDGTFKWQFLTGDDVVSSPIVDSDGTVFVGSDDNNVYAVNQDGSERWQFPTLDDVRASPVIDASGTIYIGSNDNNFYAINRYAQPRNFRNDTVEPKKLIISDDFPAIPFATPAEWLKEGPWGVRMEVTRSTAADVDGNFIYTLKTWVEQCQNADCSDILSLNFRNTLVEYNVAGRPTKLEQTIKLSGSDHDKFDRFLFGFTTASQTGDTQQAVIRNFELSFSRSGDPVVTAD